MNIDLRCEVEGFYTLTIFKADKNGEIIPDSGRQPVPTFRNLITNGGLDRMGASGDYTYACQVGSGSTPATATDGSLVSRIAGTTSLLSNITGASPSSPYYAHTTLNYQFSAGIATGNISEVGVGWGVTGSLFSRALIVDGSGSPTTITVLADEILQVSYQIRYYAPTVDVSGSLSINGGTVNWVSRAAAANSEQYWRGAGYISEALSTDGLYVRAFDGEINALTTGSPAGASAQRSSVLDTAYSAGSYARAGTVTWGIADANFATGIKSVLVKKGIGSYQIGFSTPIMKTNTQTLTLTFTHSWARRSL
ncbi:hypothetical protein ASF84_05520 [Pseudomonas sp. Leaf127]|uniref:hypothetical protein n=1 Tax=Pseudomonas sp. Leaf127 TaxID=1736267 RepID=UPI00070379B5|nr:hypothetical protein [Pseudomonas sp. Leaf127]KQQ60166.1 hypothetical protein ASF84_05520 [Pseudomonas sp. Leaf127]